MVIRYVGHGNAKGGVIVTFNMVFKKEQDIFWHAQFLNILPDDSNHEFIYTFLLMH